MSRKAMIILIISALVIMIASCASKQKIIFGKEYYIIKQKTNVATATFYENDSVVIIEHFGRIKASWEQLNKNTISIYSRYDTNRINGFSIKRNKSHEDSIYIKPAHSYFAFMYLLLIDSSMNILDTVHLSGLDTMRRTKYQSRMKNIVLKINTATTDTIPYEYNEGGHFEVLFDYPDYMLSRYPFDLYEVHKVNDNLLIHKPRLSKRHRK